MNFQKVAYVPELDHRLKNKGETREFGKRGFCGIWEILIKEWMEYRRMMDSDKERNKGRRIVLEGNFKRIWRWEWIWTVMYFNITGQVGLGHWQLRPTKPRKQSVGESTDHQLGPSFSSRHKNFMRHTWDLRTPSTVFRLNDGPLMGSVDLSTRSFPTGFCLGFCTCNTY